MLSRDSETAEFLFIKLVTNVPILGIDLVNAPCSSLYFNLLFFFPGTKPSQTGSTGNNKLKVRRQPTQGGLIGQSILAQPLKFFNLQSKSF